MAATTPKASDNDPTVGETAKPMADDDVNMPPLPLIQKNPQTSVVGDASEEEGGRRDLYRKPEGGGLEFLVKWKCGEKTWEPFENVAETGT